MMKKIKLLIAIILIFQILLCLIVYLLAKPAPELDNSDQEANITVTGQEGLDKEEERNLTLNFNSTQVVINLYPYANKNREDYKYRLFEIVYVASVNSNEQFISKYISPGEDWTGSYISSTETDTIYMAMSKQIWHKMELKSKDDLNSACTKNPVELADGYIAESYNCDDSISFCYLPIDQEQGLVYSTNPGSNEPLDFCTIAKQNSISGISLKSY